MHIIDSTYKNTKTVMLDITKDKMAAKIPKNPKKYEFLSSKMELTYKFAFFECADTCHRLYK